MTDAQLAELLRPHVKRIADVAVARHVERESGAHPYPVEVTTFSAGASAFVPEDARNYSSYFADTDGMYPEQMHAYFGCGPKEFADHSGLVRKQITDSLGRRSWRWVRRDTGAPATPQAGPQPTAPETELVPQPKGKVARARAALAERLSKTRGGRALLALGSRGLKAAHVVESYMLVMAKKTQAVAVQAAEERGLSPEKKGKLKAALYVADFFGGYVTGAAAGAVGGLWAAKAAMVAPSASAFYLLYSTARNPLATLRAARKVMKRTFDRSEPAAHAAGFAAEPFDISAHVGEIADAIEAAPDADDWLALFCVALPETQDISAAVELANAANHHDEGPDEDDESDEDESETFSAGATEDSDDEPDEFAAAKKKPAAKKPAKKTPAKKAAPKAKAKPKKVQKEIEVTIKKGPRAGATYKRKVWVLADDDAPAEKPAPPPVEEKPAPAPKAEKPKKEPKPKPEKPKKPDPKEVADGIRAALADPAALTPEKVEAVKKLLDSLTVPQIRALKTEQGLKGGKTKADHVKSLVDRAKALGAPRRESKGGSSPSGPTDTVSDVVRDVVRDFGARGTRPEEVNRGECLPFAERVVAGLRERGVDARIGAASSRDWHEHVWVVANGKHYDAEHPEGVDDPKELTFFKRDARLLNSGWAAVSNRKQLYQLGKGAAETAPGFTGRDALGREWRDGKLVAKKDEPAPQPPQVEEPPAPPAPPVDEKPSEPAPPAPEPEPPASEVPAEAPAAPPVEDAPAPSPQPAYVGHAVGRTLAEGLNASTGLTDAQRDYYAAASKRVLESLPKAALDRMAENLTGVQFHPSTQAIMDGALAQMAANGAPPESIEKARQVLDGQSIGGLYMNHYRSIHVDGDHDIKHEDTGAHGWGKVNRATGVYAHEMAHALDGPEQIHSRSAAWTAIFNEEMIYSRERAAAGELPRLSRYGGVKANEAFAEFGRLVYGSDVPHEQIAREFPKATAYFKAMDWWPATERAASPSVDENGAKMAEVFDRSVPLSADGKAHADTLLKAQLPKA